MSAAKLNGLLAAAAGLFLIMSVAYVLVSQAHHQSLLEQRRTITALGEELTQVTLADKKEREKVAAEEIGAGPERIQTDREVISKLLNTSLTWESNAEYVAARESMMRSYELSPDSQFMRTFLPRPPISKDSDGNEYPYIDAAELNSWVGSFQPNLVSVKGTEYHYVVLARVNSSSASGQGTATRVATISLTLDGEEKITELAGYAATKPARQSGDGG